MKELNASLSFFLEIGMLAAFVYLGFHDQKSLLFKLLVGVAVPSAIIFFWSVFMAPRSSRRLALIPRLAITSLLFILGAFALYQSGQAMLAIVFVIVVCINVSGSFIMKQ